MRLEDALEALLRDQILERERVERLDRPDLYGHDSDCEEDDKEVRSYIAPMWPLYSPIYPLFSSYLAPM